MVQDSLFEKVTLEVRKTCESLNYECSFNRESSSINVYGRLTGEGCLVITSTLIESISSIPTVIFNSVWIDSSCRLCALFFIDDNV